MVAPPTRPDLSQTYRRLHRVSTHSVAHPSRQPRRSGLRSSHVGTEGRRGDDVAANYGLSKDMTALSLVSSQLCYEVVHTTPARGSHARGGHQEDSAQLGGVTNPFRSSIVEDLEGLVQSRVEGNSPPQLTKTSPTPSPSNTIGHSPPITISQRAGSTLPSHAALSVSPPAKSSHSGSSSYITPDHPSPDNLDRRNSSTSADVSPDTFVFKTPQASFGEVKALFPQQDSSPPAKKDGERKEQDGVHGSFQEEVPPSQHTHQHRPGVSDEPQVRCSYQHSVVSDLPSLPPSPSHPSLFHPFTLPPSPSHPSLFHPFTLTPPSLSLSLLPLSPFPPHTPSLPRRTTCRSVASSCCGALTLPLFCWVATSWQRVQMKSFQL